MAATPDSPRPAPPPLEPGLYVVATPIGNLRDITLRAIDTLAAADRVICEDTRLTGRLLTHFGLKRPLLPYHEHNAAEMRPKILALLRAGQALALVSDAGTPLVSDPGAFLVTGAHQAGIRVEPVPGPSAAMAALSASGIVAQGVLFMGFPPSRSTHRKRWLEAFRSSPYAVVFYEAPHRIADTLANIVAVLGDRRAAVGRELTKLHEKLVVRHISEHIAELGIPKGEYTVVLEPAPEAAGHVDLPSPAVLRAEFGQLTDKSEGSRRDCVRQLAAKYNVGPREMYRLLEDDTPV